MAREEYHSPPDDFLLRCGGWPGFQEILAEMQITWERRHPPTQLDGT